LYEASAVGQAGTVPRRTAAERHLDSAPTLQDDDVLEVLIAIHHPTRRWLVELLALEGPASVGRLAARTGLAVGSVSHHLKTLHRHGFVEPAPDLARDTRESWWRGVRKSITWSTDDFPGGTAGRRVAEAAEVEDFRHQVRAVRQWLSRAGQADEAWRRAASSTDSVVFASAAELRDLGRRLQATIHEWSAERLAAGDPQGAVGDADDTGSSDPDRRPVRVIARAFPTGPVRP
jgi:DNA-binding transcriptional ArsR family regulator